MEAKKPIRVHIVDLSTNRKLRCKLCVAWDCEKCPFKEVVLM